jgi:hypothetical protein
MSGRRLNRKIADLILENRQLKEETEEFKEEMK